MHAAGALADPRRQQLLRDQLIVAAIMNTLSVSPERGTAGIFPVVGVAHFASVGIPMGPTHGHLPLSACLQFLGGLVFAFCIANGTHPMLKAKLPKFLFDSHN
jgi:hypothetical protein